MKVGDKVRVPDGRTGRITVDWMHVQGEAVWRLYGAKARFEVYFGIAYRNSDYNEDELTAIE